MKDDFQVDKLVVGQLQTNCYFLIGKQKFIIVDPGDDAKEILDHASKLSSTPLAVICTHSHFDHILAAQAVKEELGVPFCVHEKDADSMNRMWEYSTNLGIVADPPEPDIVLKGNEGWDLGGESISLLHTPGHTAGSISLLVGNMIFSGDTLFNGSIGRTDLGGNNTEMIKSLALLSKLDPEMRVHPGHGPETTIGDEIETMEYFIGFLARS